MTLHHLTEPMESRLAGNIRRHDELSAEIGRLKDAIKRDGRAYADARGLRGPVRLEWLRQEFGL